MEPTTKKEGWAQPSNTRKWHYFRNGMSLCGRWAIMFQSEFEPEDKPSKDDCAECRRRVNKEKK